MLLKFALSFFGTQLDTVWREIFDDFYSTDRKT